MKKTIYLVPKVESWTSFYRNGMQVSFSGPEGSCGFMHAYTNKKAALKVAKRLGFKEDDLIKMEQQNDSSWISYLNTNFLLKA